MSWIIATMAFFVMATTTQGYKETLGTYFESSRALENVKGVFLLEDLLLREGVVYQFVTRVVSTTPVRFQIWRPIDLSLKKYRLVGETRLVSNVVPTKVQIDFKYRHEFIYSKYGDRVGIYSETSTCPVGYRMLLSQSRVFHYTPPDGGPIPLESEVEFESLNMPYEFSLKVSYDTDVAQYRNAPNGGGTLPTTPTTPRPQTIPAYPENQGTIFYAGNSLETRYSAREREARGVYLLHNIKLRKGVVTDFFAFFVRADPVWFQIWRLTKYEDTFQLVGQKRFSPENIPRAIKVPLQQGEHIFVEDNDMLGFTNEYDSGPIGYSFVDRDTVAAAGPFSAALQGDALPRVGETLQFNTIGLPYDFAIGVNYDTLIDMTKYGAAVTIPSPKTSTVTTSKVTTTSPTTPPIDFAEAEHTIGGEFLKPSDSFVPDGARKTFLLGELSFTQNALITSFWAYFVNGGSVQFQVLLPEGERILVQPGDCLAFANENDTGLIGYKFEAANLYYSENGSLAAVGESLEFDVLPFPYKFSMAATFIDVPPESTTPGKANPNNNGQNTPKKPQPVVGNEGKYGWLNNPDALLGLFIWLCILTVLFIGLCILLCCRRCKKQETQDRRYYAQPYSVNSGVRPSSAYMANMKDDQSIDYFNPTIGNNSTRGMNSELGFESRNGESNGSTLKRTDSQGYTRM